MGTAIRMTILALAAGGVVATCTLAVIQGQQQPAKSPPAYTIGVWEGQLAVFEGENGYPKQLLEVEVAGLPKEEQERLKQGVSVETEQQLYLLLEDYTS